MKATLFRGELHYNSVTLHTAASGEIDALDTLWLRMDDGTHQGIGEVRLNIHYLHGYSAEKVLHNVTQTLTHWDWTLPPQSMLAAVHAPDSTLLAPTRMLIDMALHDLLARRSCATLPQWLGATATAPGYRTNQTLFWASESQMIAQAQRYVERGFSQLKLRTGIADIATDVARLRKLRDIFGSDVSLAIDVNGQWSLQQAQYAFPALYELNLSYVEQPLAVSDDCLLTQLSGWGVPIMLDESLNSPSAIDRLIAANGALWGHLKLVKLGGIAPTVAAAQRLREAGIPFMIGQMNEGHVATAAALQVCRVLQPQFAELYGADGLIDDPASGLSYQHGEILVADSYGLGVHFDAARATFHQEFSHATAK